MVWNLSHRSWHIRVLCAHMREIFITISGEREKIPGVHTIQTHDIVYLDISKELKNYLSLDNLALIFTSKNALIALMRSIQNLDSKSAQKIMSSSVFAYGERVCKMAKEMRMNIAYCGHQSSADIFLSELDFTNLMPLFLCAEKIACLPPKNIKKLICYKAKMRENLPKILPKQSTVIFCSGLQVDAMKDALDESMTVIALGNRTYEKLSELSMGFKLILSPKMSISCCIEQARKQN